MFFSKLFKIHLEWYHTDALSLICFQAAVTDTCQVCCSLISAGYRHFHDPRRGHPQDPQRRVRVIPLQPCSVVTSPASTPWLHSSYPKRSDLRECISIVEDFSKTSSFFLKIKHGMLSFCFHSLFYLQIAVTICDWKLDVRLIETRASHNLIYLFASICIHFSASGKVKSRYYWISGWEKTLTAFLKWTWFILKFKILFTR